MATTYPPPAENRAPIRLVERARQLREENVDIIDLGSGTPDFVTPDHVIEAGKEALANGNTKAVSTAGLSELREVLARKFRNENDIPAHPSTVGVTPGSKFGAYASIRAIVHEGDEVVLLEPSWVYYKPMIDLAGGVPKKAFLDPDSGFSLKNVNLSEQVSDDTRAVLLNTPSNPAGAVFGAENLSEIRDLALDYDFWVISDEIYEAFTYDVEHISIGSLDGMKDRTVTINGLSKSHAMSGWRLGYLTGPQGIVDVIQTIQSQTVSCAPSFVQHAAVSAIDGPQEPIETMRQTYESRISAGMTVLENANINIPRPKGALYLFVPTTTENDISIAETILEEQQVLTIPGSAFGVPGYLRLACTVPESRLKIGIGRITQYLESTG